MSTALAQQLSLPPPLLQVLLGSPIRPLPASGEIVVAQPAETDPLSAEEKEAEVQPATAVDTNKDCGLRMEEIPSDR